MTVFLLFPTGDFWTVWRLAGSEGWAVVSVFVLHSFGFGDRHPSSSSSSPLAVRGFGWGLVRARPLGLVRGWRWVGWCSCGSRLVPSGLSVSSSPFSKSSFGNLRLGAFAPSGPQKKSKPIKQITLLEFFKDHVSLLLVIATVLYFYQLDACLNICKSILI